MKKEVGGSAATSEMQVWKWKCGGYGPHEGFLGARLGAEPLWSSQGDQGAPGQVTPGHGAGRSGSRRTFPERVLAFVPFLNFPTKNNP